MVSEMMPSFRQLHPVHSTKHIVDKQGALAVDTLVAETIVKAVDAPVKTSVTEVETSSTVSAMFLNIQVAATSTASVANVYMYVIKSPGNNLNMVDANKVGTSDIKKFVIHQEMTMTEKNTTAIPRTLFKGVIKIPRGYKRFGADDQLKIVLYSPGVTYEYCIQSIYKELR